MSGVVQSEDASGEEEVNASSSNTLFSYLLSRFRTAHNTSQEELATDANTTPRYISFLENSRANASYAMIERLGTALELEPTNYHRLLQAGGFVPKLGTETPADPNHVAEIRTAARVLLDSHHPHPGFAMDADWNLLAVNAGAERFMRLRGYTAEAPTMQGYNLIEVTLDPDGLKPVITNWEEYAWYCLCCLEQQAMRREEPQRILERVRQFPDIERIETGDMAAVDLSGPIGRVQVDEGTCTRAYRGIRCIFDDPTDTVARKTRLGLLFPLDALTGESQAQDE